MNSEPYLISKFLFKRIIAMVTFLNIVVNNIKNNNNQKRNRLFRLSLSCNFRRAIMSKNTLDGGCS